MRAFISYVRENSAAVDRLAEVLEAAGVEVWLDRTRLLPGMRWADEIRLGISAGDSFIACFSKEYALKSRTYMNEELTLAIDELRRRPADTAWFIPVKLTECEIPDRSIGGGETLRSLQWVELHTDWNNGIRRILTVLAPLRPPLKRTGARVDQHSTSDPPLFLIKAIPKAQVRRLVREQFGTEAQVNWKKREISHRARASHKFFQELWLGEWLDKYLKPELLDVYGAGHIDYFETEDEEVVRVYWESDSVHRILGFTQERVFQELRDFGDYMSERGLSFFGSIAILLLVYRALQLHAFDQLSRWNWGTVREGIWLWGAETSILWALLSWLIWSWEQHTGRQAVIDQHVGRLSLDVCPLQCLANIEGRENEIVERVVQEERLSPPVGLIDLKQLLDDLGKDSVIAPAIAELRAKLT